MKRIGKWQQEIIKIIEAHGMTCVFHSYTGKDHLRFQVGAEGVTAFIVTSNTHSDEQYVLKNILGDAKRAIRRAKEIRVANSARQSPAS